MATKIRAVYDGKALLRLKDSLDLPPDTEVELTVAAVDERDEPGGDYCFIDTALALDIEGPTDWSTRVDEILYKYPRDASE